jgi:hypothetical protein
MLVQRRRLRETGGRRSGDTAGVGRVWRDRACPGKCSRAGQAQRALGCGLAVLLVCLLALPAEAAPRAAPAAPGDEYWAATFHRPGIIGSVKSLAVGLDGTIYAGGNLAAAGAVLTHHIARWDGSRWRPLGSGMNNEVVASAV